MLKKAINYFLDKCGYSIVRKKTIPRMSLEGVLNQIGYFWKPELVVDVGAAFGEWSKCCYKKFSAAQYLLLEPLAEYQQSLKKLKNTYSNINFVLKAANSTQGSFAFNVHTDLVGSSLNTEVEGPKVDGVQRHVECTTLDSVVKEYCFNTKSCLLKIDVQGSELEVLKGATELLKNTQVIILECSLFKSFSGGPDVYEVIRYMQSLGFVLYDIAGVLYRPYDNALCQADLVFVPEESVFRAFHGFATPEQREKQNEYFTKKHHSMVK